MNNVLISLLVDILEELTQIRLVLTNDFDPEDIAQDTVKILQSKKYLSKIIAGYNIMEV